MSAGMDDIPANILNSWEAYKSFAYTCITFIHNDYVLKYGQNEFDHKVDF